MKSSKDIHKLAEDIQEDFSDSVLDDFSKQLNELKGILGEALGDVPFKCAILVVVLFNLLYTLYHTFLATRTDNVIENDCYCDSTDRVFYRTITLISIIFWVCFLSIYAFISTFGHGHFTRYNEATQQNSPDVPASEDQDYEFSELFDMVTKQEESFQAQLKDLVSTKFLDYDYAKSIELRCVEIYGEITDGENTRMSARNRATSDVDNEETRSGASDVNNEETRSGTSDVNNEETRIGTSDVNNKETRSGTSDVNNEETHRVEQFRRDKTVKKQPTRWYCFMFTKIILIMLRFVFRLLIVPLLQLQWFNEYAWNCLMNNVIRNYCETDSTKYYIGLDHSFVLYSVYILLLIALLFSFIINWFPKGIPEVTLHYKAVSFLDALKKIKKLRLNINKKGHFHYTKKYAYKPIDHGVEIIDHGVETIDHGVETVDHGVKIKETTF